MSLDTREGRVLGRELRTRHGPARELVGGISTLMTIDCWPGYLGCRLASRTWQKTGGSIVVAEGKSWEMRGASLACRGVSAVSAKGRALVPPTPIWSVCFDSDSHSKRQATRILLCRPDIQHGRFYVSRIHFFLELESNT